MYLYDYLWFLGAIVFCMLFGIFANAKINSTFAKYNGVMTRSGMTGYSTAVRLMEANGIYDIAIGRASGHLTDHYNPSKKIVNLSDSTYNSSSVAAVAVAAHEMGHVMQKKNAYVFYNIRTALVPIVNFGAGLALPLVLIGLLLNIFATSLDENIGFYIALVGVLLYGTSFLFTLVTYPVERNASKRAKKMLVAEGILTEEEIKGASAVLSAAALTYLAALLTQLVYFLRFFVMVMTLFGRRNR